jgi:hypothetical protein
MAQSQPSFPQQGPSKLPRGESLDIEVDEDGRSLGDVMRTRRIVDCHNRHVITFQVPELKDEMKWIAENILYRVDVMNRMPPGKYKLLKAKMNHYGFGWKFSRELTVGQHQ